jgi:hypothetical protein
MRVAALYDVHGMPHALEAVLAEFDTDAVVFGGDLVAGPFPRETLALARSVAGALFVRGNAERDPHEWVRSQLPADEVESMRAWPERVELVGMQYEGEVAAFWAVVSDDVEFRRTPFDVERAAAEIGASAWPGAAEFVAENLLAVPTRDEAIAVFGG